MTSCLCCILATISSNMRCRLFLAKRQLSQSGIVSMFCFPKTFSIKIMPSSLEQCWKIICNSPLPDFSLKIQWFLRRPQFETSSLLFNFEILTISLWLGRCCNFYISQKVSFLNLNCSAKIETQIREIDFLKHTSPREDSTSKVVYCQFLFRNP